MIQSIRFHDNEAIYLEFTEVTEKNDIIVFFEIDGICDSSISLEKKQVEALVTFLKSQLKNFDNG